MLLQVYNALRTKLDAVPNVQHIDWFNDQYAGTIHAEPGIFIEFPDVISFETLRKQTQQGNLIVRVHTYSKLVAQQDKSLDETIIQRHFDIAKEIYQRLQGFRADNGNNLLFNSMNRIALQHHQYLQGWFITTQDFDCMLYDIQVYEEIPAPQPIISMQ